MADLNTVTVTGNLGDTPSLQSVRGPDGPRSVLNMQMAINPPDSAWGRTPDASWVGITAWGAMAENLAESPLIHKGAAIHVTGRLQVTQREIDGVRRTFVTIHATRVSFPNFYVSRELKRLGLQRENPAANVEDEMDFDFEPFDDDDSETNSGS